MKLGDKVWFYDDRVERIIESEITAIGHVEEYQFAEVLDVASAIAYDIMGKQPVMRVHKDRVFPTREALCEHYRKIFE